MVNRVAWLSAVATVAAACGAAGAWTGPGHERAVRQAVALLPNDFPRWFAEQVDTLAHCSQDPDTFTRPIAPAELHATESPEHYFDMEPLDGAKLPATRYEYLALLYERKLQPGKVGLLPYAITEWTQRLTVALAEHRAWPDDPAIRAKCLVYAGILSHYAADACQPLHTTINYDGKAKADGSSPRSGIHLRVDALLRKLPADAEAGIKAEQVKPFEKLFPAVLAQIDDSHALAEKVYELDKDIPAIDDPLKSAGPAAEFATERLKASSAFIARLFATAWANSADVKLPDWHKREREAARTASSQPAIQPAASIAATQPATVEWSGTSATTK